MEFEQLIKKLDWLDNEHRKDKEAISDIQEKVTTLETSLNGISQQLKELGKQVSEVSTASVRINQFDEMLVKLRTDLNKTIDNLEKKHQKRESDAAKRHQAEFEGVAKTIAEIRTSADPRDLKKKFKERADETQRLLDNITDLKKHVEQVLETSQELIQNRTLSEDARKVDLKRLADLQGEITAVRKRSDENREKSILHGDSLRNIDTRLTELFTNEAKRDQAQAAFLEDQARAQAERDHAWREWRDKYDTFQKEADTLSAQMQSIDETLRGAKRAQETYQELNTKLERRIGEVMELQRLAEERLRQEWVTFKSDDQKRWTAYTLSAEGASRDLRKDLQRLDKTVSTLDDLSQTMQDQLHQTTDTTEQQLQELMNTVHQWMTSYERIMGHNKKPKK